MHSNRERLKKSSSLEADTVGYFVTPHSRVIDSFLQGTLKRRHVLRSLGTTPEPHLLAKIVTASSTNSTGTTWNANLKSYSVIDLKTFDPVTNGTDDARRFMAETEASFGTTDISIPTLLIVTYI
jgi:hypothetical protein